MYDPAEANKKYINLLKENGVSSGVKSAVLVIAIYFYNQLIAHQDTSRFNIALIYLFFCIYFTFKPKLIRFLRGHLRGDDFRDKPDQ